MLWALTACLNADADSADSAAGSAWTGQEQAPEEALWTADEVTARIDALVAGLPEAGALIDRYLALLAEGDADCPGSETRIDSATLGLDGCTAESGVSYAGEASLVDVSVGDGSSRTLVADCLITTPDGERFEGGGYATEVDTPASSTQELLGSFTFEGASWSAGLTRGAGEATGGISGEEGSLVFDGVSLEDGCLAGAVELAQDGQGWYRLVLDCEGCGALAWEEREHVGDTCIDADALQEALR